MQTLLKSILDRLAEVFAPTVLGDRLAAGLINLVVGVVVFFLFYIFWRLLLKFLSSSRTTAHLDQTTAAFVKSVLRYTILILGFIAALNAAGIKTAGLLASLGLAGLTIGFAARDALSNIISGVLIFIDRPFVIGDLVEIGGLYGRVDKITLRSTRIVTVDGKMVAVPNTEIINQSVASYTNFPHLRIDIDVSVAVHEDLGRARRVLLELVDQDPDLMTDPKPRVMVTQLGDYYVGLQLQTWLADERRHIEKRFALRELAFEALRSADIEMPFETLQVVSLPKSDEQTHP